MTTVGVRMPAQLTLSTAFQTVFTVYRNGTYRVSLIHLVNMSAAAVTVRVCIVAPGMSADQSNAILWDYSIPAHDFIQFDEGDFWGSEYTLQALASVANTVNIRVSGYQE